MDVDVGRNGDYGWNTSKRGKLKKKVMNIDHTGYPKKVDSEKLRLTRLKGMAKNGNGVAFLRLSWRK